MSLFSELKRRNVFKVAVAYLMLSWLILQVIGVVSDILVFPGWVAQAFLLLLAVLLPIVLIITWAFELTPDGVKKTDEVEEAKSIRQTTGQKINYIIIAFLILVIGFQFWMNGDDEVPELRANTIAVLPFADMSADGSQEYFGDGMAEEILNVLVSVDELDVASRTSSFAFKDQNLLAPAIAAQLNVNYIVEGSIRSDGNNVRVTAQLIDVANDTHLWSETYDRELVSIFAIQDEISMAIADALKVELLGDVLGDVPTLNMEAYALYLQGRQLLYAPNFQIALEVRELAKRIIELDADYAEGWALLGASYNYARAFNGTEYDNVELQRLSVLSLDAIDKAISLKPKMAFSWLHKGYHHLIDKQWMDAKLSLERAIELDQKDEFSWLMLGFYYQNVGSYNDALNAYNQSIKISPANANAIRGLGNSLLNIGNIVEARSQLEQAVAMGDGFAYSVLLQLSLLEGDKDKALEYNKKAVEFAGDTISVENGELNIEAYLNPALSEEYKKLLPDLVATDSIDFFFLSLILRDGEYAVKFSKRYQTFPFYYLPRFYRPVVNQQVVKDYFTEIGLVEHWRQTKWPSFCRPIGDDDFECE